MEKAFEFSKAGRRVIDCSIFEEGIIGKLAYVIPPEGTVPEKWSTEDADTVWFVWEKFGRCLHPEKVHVTDGNQMFTVFDEHRSHPMVGYTNPMTRTAGFVCYCKVSEGKSLVYFVDLMNAKEIPPELRDALESVAPITRSRE